MRIYLVLFLIGTAVCLFHGCGDTESKSPTGTGTTTPPDTVVYDSIHWVNTSVLYDTLMAKKDYSLIIFEAPWCGYCRMLDEETLTDSVVISIMNDSYNCVKINIEADSTVVYFDSQVTCGEYAEMYEVRGIPITCILNRNGRLLGKIQGYHPPNDYSRYLDTIRNGAWDPP